MMIYQIKQRILEKIEKSLDTKDIRLSNIYIENKTLVITFYLSRLYNNLNPLETLVINLIRDKEFINLLSEYCPTLNPNNIKFKSQRTKSIIRLKIKIP